MSENSDPVNLSGNPTRYPDNGSGNPAMYEPASYQSSSSSSPSRPELPSSSSSPSSSSPSRPELPSSSSSSAAMRHAGLDPVRRDREPRAALPPLRLSSDNLRTLSPREQLAKIGEAGRRSGRAGQVIMMPYEPDNVAKDQEWILHMREVNGGVTDYAYDVVDYVPLTLFAAAYKELTYREGQSAFSRLSRRLDTESFGAVPGDFWDQKIVILKLKKYYTEKLFEQKGVLSPAEIKETVNALPDIMYMPYSYWKRQHKTCLMGMHCRPEYHFYPEEGGKRQTKRKHTRRQTKRRQRKN